jgi:hypothetical protein
MKCKAAQERNPHSKSRLNSASWHTERQAFDRGFFSARQKARSTSLTAVLCCKNCFFLQLKISAEVGNYGSKIFPDFTCNTHSELVG